MKQSSRSLSPATKSFTQDIHPISKPSSQHKHEQQDIHPISKPPSQYKHEQILSQFPSLAQRNRLLQDRQGREEERAKNGETSCDIMQSLK